MKYPYRYIPINKSLSPIWGYPYKCMGKSLMCNSRSSTDSRKVSLRYQWQERSLQKQLLIDPWASWALSMQSDWILVYESFLRITDPFIPHRRIKSKGKLDRPHVTLSHASKTSVFLSWDKCCNSHQYSCIHDANQKGPRQRPQQHTIIHDKWSAQV